MLQLFGGIELAMLTVHNHCNSHLGNLSIALSVVTTFSAPNNRPWSDGNSFHS